MVAQKSFLEALSACFAGSELPPFIPHLPSIAGTAAPLKGRVHAGAKADADVAALALDALFDIATFAPRPKAKGRSAVAGCSTRLLAIRPQGFVVVVVVVLVPVGVAVEVVGVVAGGAPFPLPLLPLDALV